MRQASQLSIDEGAITHNLHRLSQSASGAKVMAVIKSNAYGHGLLTAARALSRADAFAITDIEDLFILRRAGFKKPVLLLQGCNDPEMLAQCAAENAWPVIHNETTLRMLERNMQVSGLTVWIKIDIGMHRLGFSVERLHEVLDRLKRCTGVQVKGIMGHFSHAFEQNNSTTAKQIKQFCLATADLNLERSLANSAGLLAWPESHLDWVRPGVSLYGISPFEQKIGKDFGLLPAMQFRSRLINIQPVKGLATVGYGGQWAAPQEGGLIGVVGSGYAHGYPRTAAKGTPVLIGDQKVSLVGCVSMEMLTVTLQANPFVKVGDPVTLWGQGLPVERIAAQSGTIPYELTCRAGNALLSSTNAAITTA